MSSTLKFTKVERGHYATEDGCYAAVVDGYGPGADEDYQGGEWAAVYSPNGGLREDSNVGENLDWFPTMREARACAESHYTNHIGA